MTTKVLVVDDSRVARAHIAGVLREAGYDVVEACDGEDALCAMMAHRDLEMIVCDLNMPRVNGLEVLIAVKQEPVTAHVPFLMLTTEAQPELIQEAKQRGAAGWMLKPVKSAMLLAVIRKLARRAA